MLTNVVMWAVMAGYTTTMQKAIEIAEHERMLHRIYAISGTVLAVSSVIFIVVGVMLLRDRKAQKNETKKYHINKDGSIDVDYEEVA